MNRTLEFDYELDYPAWREISAHLAAAPSNMDREFHRWVLEYWGGCEQRAITYLLRGHGAITTFDPEGDLDE